MDRKDLVKKFSKATAIGLSTVAGAYFTADVIGYTYGTEEQTCFTVVDKNHIPKNISAEDAQSRYFISTDQGEVFENADSFWRFKSSDDTQQLQDQLSIAEAELGVAKSSVASEDFSNAEMSGALELFDAEMSQSLE